MMDDQKIFTLLNRLLDDAGTPEFYWLAGALLAIFGFSWWISHYVRRGSELARGHHAILDFGAGGVKRLAFPLVTLMLVVSLRGILEYLAMARLALLDAASLLLLSWALVRTFVYVLRDIFPSGGFLNESERVTSLTIWGCLILKMTGLSGPVVDGLEKASFSVGQQDLNLWMLLKGSVTVCVTLLVALWIGSQLERRLLGARDMDANLREVLARLTKALLSVIALLFALSLIGIDITALSVFSGALAVGLGMGLQRIASNYVSGFIILLDRSIRLGNLIALDDSTSGLVTRITTRYTVLRTLSGTEYIIPNEYLVSNMVRNLSFSDNRIRVATTIGVGYDTDIDRAAELLVGIAQAHPRVLADPKPGVGLTSFGDSALMLELDFWLGDPEKGSGGVRSDINREILRVFREEGISIPFPQREVRVLGNAR